MTEMLDLLPAAARVAGIVEGIRAHQLTGPTPCADATVAAVLDHVLGLATAFEAAARKDFGPLTDHPPRPSADALPDDWRDSARPALTALARAWAEPSAWTGTTRAGGLEFPAAAAGLVALDELVVHGWDLAVATDQTYRCTPDEIAACTAFAEPITDEQRTAGGLFGPVVPVAADATAWDRLLALTGRDPAWSPVRR
ncbi:TIGR03086 family metal-binding protein [Rhodococcus yananensis]|nr:TIGR03086 family metal-binding protein [Rhodococcus yananensis]